MIAAHLPKVKSILKHRYTLMYGVPSFTILLILLGFFFYRAQMQERELYTLSNEKIKNEKQLQSEYKKLQEEFSALKNVDQVKRNDTLEKEIKDIQTTYSSAMKTYETLQDLKVQKVDTTKYEKDFILLLSQLAQKNYSSGSATLTTLNQKITQDQQKLAASQPASSATTANVPVNNAAPGSGYSQQKVRTDIGEYVVSLVAGDLNSTRVIVDTATDGDCRDNCPVLPLGDYVARNGAFAGINGTYFCPASYPTCAGKTNSFDLLVMNKNKKYINSDNNVYSTNPAVIFSGNSARFVGQALEWGRDTGVDSVISNYPLLLSGGNITFNGDGDPKKGSKGARSFVAVKGSTAYIGVVSNATVAEAAHALKALGMENAMNLDSGGSTALWSGGYKFGPGRAIPNALLFVRK